MKIQINKFYDFGCWNCEQLSVWVGRWTKSGGARLRIEEPAGGSQ